jgi:hypothetical protein
MKAIIIFAILSSAVPLVANGQASDSIPKVKINFETDGGTPVSLPSMVMYKLPVCSSSSSCYALFALDPTKGFEVVIDGFSASGKSHITDPGAIEGLSYVHILDFAPKDGGVAVLLHASISKNGSVGQKLVPKPSTQPEAASLKESGDYVALFDGEGRLQEFNRLSLRLRPVKLAHLGSERFLVLGIDPANHQSAMAIVTSSGEFVRLIQTEDRLPDGDELLAGMKQKIVPADAPERMREVGMTAALSRWQFGYAGGRLLLLDPAGENSVIWSISPGGDVRKISLKVPQGATPMSIVSSTDAWLVRAFFPGDVGALLEFDPDNGTVRRQIDSQPAPPTSIFYADNGTYYALKWNKNLPFILSNK